MSATGSYGCGKCTAVWKSACAGVSGTCGVQAAVRSKALLAIERDRLQSRVKALEAQLAETSDPAAATGEASQDGRNSIRSPGTDEEESDWQNKRGRRTDADKSLSGTKASKTAVNSTQGRGSHPLDTQWPTGRRVNPHCSSGPYAEVIPSSLQPILSVKAHAAPVTSLCFHPTLPLCESVWAARGRRCRKADAEALPVGEPLQ